MELEVVDESPAPVGEEFPVTPARVVLVVAGEATVVAVVGGTVDAGWEAGVGGTPVVTVVVAWGTVVVAAGPWAVVLVSSPRRMTTVATPAASRRSISTNRALAVVRRTGWILDQPGVWAGHDTRAPAARFGARRRSSRLPPLRAGLSRQPG
jgi:hypothetical protein